MQAASKRAQTIEPPEHLVQFYEADPAAWAKSVGRFLADGLKQGEAVLVIATPEHKKAIVRQLNALGCCDSNFFPSTMVGWRFWTRPQRWRRSCWRASRIGINFSSLLAAKFSGFVQLR